MSHLWDISCSTLLAAKALRVKCCHSISDAPRQLLTPPSQTPTIHVCQPFLHETSPSTHFNQAASSGWAPLASARLHMHTSGLKFLSGPSFMLVPPQRSQLISSKPMTPLCTLAYAQQTAQLLVRRSSSSPVNVGTGFRSLPFCTTCAAHSFQL